MTVAICTTSAVATYVLLASLVTQLGWHCLFLLIGSESHKKVHQELPFTNVLQTFWVGAVVCPVGAYVVRVTFGSFIAFVPSSASLARQKVMMFGKRSNVAHFLPNAEDHHMQDREDELENTTLAAAFAVAFFCASLAEEPAKYFGLARYYPSRSTSSGVTSNTLTTRTSRQSLEHRYGSADTLKGPLLEYNYWFTRCWGPKVGCFTPVSNPRIVVYLGFV